MNIFRCRLNALNDTNLKLFVTGIALFFVARISGGSYDQPDDILWGGFGYSLHARYPIKIFWSVEFIPWIQTDADECTEDESTFAV